jgi:predicted TIM-barrel fold metal-dependent hydrolase
VPQLHLPEISHVIQLAVAPVFLLAGVGAIVNVIAGRLGRIIDRARTLEAKVRTGEGRIEEIGPELVLLSRRGWWVNMSMILAVVCALLVCLLIALAFVDAFLPLNLSVIVAVLFVGAMFCFSGSLLAFLREILLASATLRFGILRAEDSGSRKHGNVEGSRRGPPPTRARRTMSHDRIDRRSFLRAATAAAVAASASVLGGKARAQQVPFSSGTEAPKLHAPANACDCHMHIYDSRFPVASTATLRPPDAHVDAYRLYQKRIGTTRTVVVTPSTYGTDNRCTLDAVAQFGSIARAVAVVDATVSDEELERLDRLGVRGIRFNLVQKGATTVEMVEPLSKRVNALGWHVQIHMLADQIVQIEDLLLRLPSPIVFDHMGRIPEPAGVKHPAFGVIRKLLDSGRTWVKVSGAYHDTKLGPPGYADTSAVARAYIQAAPERMVWGSDWPHPTEKQNKPDDAVLFDLLEVWAPDERTRHRILVENPQALYGFPS